jgi:cation diffusion facilitator family transporter
MIELEKTHPVQSRERAGRQGSIVGICVNVLLSGLKFVAGALSGSVSVTGDAINNLSDAASSVISLISFKISGKPADKQHPFGHARIEYLGSSAVAFLMLLAAFELFKTSIGKIVAPDIAQFSILSICVLGFSILAKLWLNRFYTRTGKKIDSPVLRAAAADSLSDVIATSAVLLCAVFSPVIHFQLDGYMGLAVAVYIAVSGLKIVKSTLDQLIGKEPSAELTEKIEAFIMEYPEVLRIHDLVVHDYGPKRCFASVHAEVDAGRDILESHDVIDNIEHEIEFAMGIHLVIHMDPVVTGDPYVDEMHQLAEQAVAGVDGKLTLHDFRVVKGTTHSNLIFDVVVPYDCKQDDDQITCGIADRLRAVDSRLHTVITIDRAYVSTRRGKNGD